MKTKSGSKRQILFDYLIIFAGSILYAAAVDLFIQPMNIPLGGLSGIALLINKLTSFPIGVSFIIMNIPLFIISWKKLGHGFIVKTLFSTLISSAIIDAFTGKFGKFTDDPMLAALYGGVLMGLGLGLIFSRGATAGGSDILTKLINRRLRHISIGNINMVINIIVIAASAFVYRSAESILYAIIIQFVSGYLLDLVINGMDNASAALIVTNRPEEVSAAIIDKLHRGVTSIPGTGMYSKEPRYTLICACRANEISNLKRTVFSEDSEAFVILTSAKEVTGKGFKSFGQ